MSLSRGLSLMRQTTSLSKTFGPSTQQIRNSGGLYSYRCGAYPAPKHKIILAEIMGASMWCWVIYNVISEPEHLTGEFLWPDVKQWTDQELGIPPDDAE